MKGLKTLLEGLRREGAEEVERTLEEARDRAAAILAEADADSRRARDRTLAAARSRARTESARRVAARAVELHRELLEERRRALDAVLDRASELLSHLEPAPELARRLGREALSYLPPGSALVQCPPEAIESLRKEGAGRDDLELGFEPRPGLAGVVATDGAESIVVEATLPVLLESRRARLAVELQRRIEEEE